MDNNVGSCDMDNPDVIPYWKMTVPKGHAGLLEITTSLLNDNEAETAAEDAQHSQINSYVESPPNQNDRSDNLDIRDEIVGADSDTASANSATLTAGSDTLSVYSDPETLDVQCEVETYSQPDGS
ncbi:hypothetical protein KGM_214504 [Danaus plexippus plexippus]|uniref:Uncharacterized protein n=1 Tax=Danaus plexippus plexippus TaxID=278856 RepID=A0A212F8F2_DANPL|nr:hypothetical protein KGM_214504 [Danaus plexippus plexippus]